MLGIEQLGLYTIGIMAVQQVGSLPGLFSIVIFPHIQEKYGLERYTVSRNAVMLSKEGIKDKRASDGVREGKGWVKSQDYIPNPKKVKNIKDRPPSDSRLKSLVLTTKGRNVAEIMFR